MNPPVVVPCHNFFFHFLIISFRLRNPYLWFRVSGLANAEGYISVLNHMLDLSPHCIIKSAPRIALIISNRVYSLVRVNSRNQ